MSVPSYVYDVIILIPPSILLKYRQAIFIRVTFRGIQLDTTYNSTLCNEFGRFSNALMHRLCYTNIGFTVACSCRQSVVQKAVAHTGAPYYRIDLT